MSSGERKLKSLKVECVRMFKDSQTMTKTKYNI